jgi:hypothetical protein
MWFQVEQDEWPPNEVVEKTKLLFSILEVSSPGRVGCFSAFFHFFESFNG